VNRYRAQPNRDERRDHTLAAGLILAAVIVAAPNTLAATPTPAQWLAHAVSVRGATVDQRRVLAELLATMRSLADETRTAAPARPYAPMPTLADRTPTVATPTTSPAPPLTRLTPGLLNLPPPAHA